MFLVGLTGGIASGKTTVSNIFRELGVCIIDADIVARRVVQHGRKAWKKIVETFGPDVLDPNGEINRQVLGDIIFHDAQKRQQLNNITHPEIYKEICWEIAKTFFKGHQFVIVDTPLLFEGKFWAKYVHKIIVVSCEDDLQLQRLMDRNQLKESEAKARVSSQMPLKVKCSKADYVIDNSASLINTEEQVRVLHEELKQSKTHWKFRLLLGFIGICSGGILGLIFYLLRRTIF